MQSRDDVRSGETGDVITVLHCPGARHDDDASDSAGGPAMLVLSHPFGLGAGPTAHSNDM